MYMDIDIGYSLLTELQSFSKGIHTKYDHKACTHSRISCHNMSTFSALERRNAYDPGE